MKHRPLIASLGAVSLCAGMLVAGTSAAMGADPAPPTPIVVPAAHDRVQPPSSYPSQTPLPEVADDPADASHHRGAVPYAQIATRINALMKRSDRVSAQVVGTSVKGRDIHLVTVTAPETAAQTAQQAAWRKQIKESPQTAATDSALKAGYKMPVWANGNIHGNEWEGSDIILAFIEKLATSDDPKITDMLARHRFYFTVSNNPDGRFDGLRRNADNFDANRDMITGATPESRVIRDLAGVIQPTFFLDLHGYTDVLQIEPCGPPHGENYEYDLFLPHAYSAALAIEKAVVDANIPGNTYLGGDGEATTTNTGKIKIPYRDIRSGWDDWPPIFVPQFLAYQGAITNTVELPLGRVSDPAESKKRTEVNNAVGAVLMDTASAYAASHRDALLANQIEIFKRGVSGAPKVDIPADVDPGSVPEPREWAEIWDEADVSPVTFPRAYVIPTGKQQRSETDARRLVDQLIASGVKVGRAQSAFQAGGTEYPAGSYIVDMHQPLRGMANVLLSDGSDISDRVDSMYDVSAWSLSLLWGATVDRIGQTTDPAIGGNPAEVTAAAKTGGITGSGDYFEMRLTGTEEYRALNALLNSGARVSKFADDTVILDAADADRVAKVVADYGVHVTRTNGERLLTEPSTGIHRLKVGYTDGSGDRVALMKLGFTDLVPLDPKKLAGGQQTLDGLDAVWLGAPLARRGALDDTTKAQLVKFAERGGAITGLATAIAQVVNDTGLGSLKTQAGDGNANGILTVDYPKDSALSAVAQRHGFAYPPVWFTDLGQGVTVEQRYSSGDDVFVAGHWRQTAKNPGPAAAKGQASAVSLATKGGSKIFAFGTDTGFRTHTVGQMAWMGAALLHSVKPSHHTVPAPLLKTFPDETILDRALEPTHTAIDAPAEVALGASFAVKITGDGAAALEGKSVVATVFSSPVELGTATVKNGVARFTMPDSVSVSTHKIALQEAKLRDLVGVDTLRTTSAKPVPVPPDSGELKPMPVPPIKKPAPGHDAGSGLVATGQPVPLAAPVLALTALALGALTLGAAAARRRAPAAARRRTAAAAAASGVTAAVSVGSSSAPASGATAQPDTGSRD